MLRSAYHAMLIKSQQINNNQLRRDGVSFRLWRLLKLQYAIVRHAMIGLLENQRD